MCNSLINNLQGIGNLTLDPIEYVLYKGLSFFLGSDIETEYKARSVTDLIVQDFYLSDSGRNLNIDADYAHKSYVLSNNGITGVWPFKFMSTVGIESEYTNIADDFFNSRFWNKYGIDQNILRGEEESKLFEISKEVEKRYNMDSNDAMVFVKCLNSIGACSYANLANSIIIEFRDRPKDFEHIFGFPLYKKDDKGKIVYDDKTLIMDLYYFYNSKENGGKLFKKDSEGKSHIDIKYLEEDVNTGKRHYKEQEYAYSGEVKIGILNKYINSKKNVYNKSLINSLNIKTTTIIDNVYKRKTLSDKEVKELIEEVKYRLKCNETLMIAEYNDLDKKSINFLKPDSIDVYSSTYLFKLDDVYTSTATWDEDGGHITQITGIEGNNLVVSSWGERLYIPVADLKNGSFMINALNIID